MPIMIASVDLIEAQEGVTITATVETLPLNVNFLAGTVKIVREDNNETILSEQVNLAMDVVRSAQFIMPNNSVSLRYELRIWNTDVGLKLTEVAYVTVALTGQPLPYPYITVGLYPNVWTTFTAPSNADTSVTIYQDFIDSGCFDQGLVTTISMIVNNSYQQPNENTTWTPNRVYSVLISEARTLIISTTTPEALGSITDLTVPDSAVPGEQITITATLKNIGTAAGIFLLEFVDDTDYILKDVSNIAIATGGSYTGSCIVTMPDRDYILFSNASHYVG